MFLDDSVKAARILEHTKRTVTLGEYCPAIAQRAATAASASNLEGLL